MLKILIASALLATAAAAPAEPTTADAAAAGEKIICKRIKDSTGWRLAKREKVCKTGKEWQAESEEARREIRNSGAEGGRRY